MFLYIRDTMGIILYISIPREGGINFFWSTVAVIHLIKHSGGVPSLVHMNTNRF